MEQLVPASIFFVLKLFMWPSAFTHPRYVGSVLCVEHKLIMVRLPPPQLPICGVLSRSSIKLRALSTRSCARTHALQTPTFAASLRIPRQTSFDTSERLISRSGIPTAFKSFSSTATMVCISSFCRSIGSNRIYAHGIVLRRWSVVYQLSIAGFPDADGERCLRRNSSTIGQVLGCPDGKVCQYPCGP